MRNPPWIIRQTIVLAIAMALISCDVSPDQEAEMGAQNARAINDQVPMVTDPAINEYVSALGDSAGELAGLTDPNFKGV